MSDHEDIVQLIEAGDLGTAQAKLAERQAQGGISGQDLQMLTHALEQGERQVDVPRPGRRQRVEYDTDGGDTPAVVKEE